jgi:hypothetical protein
MEKTNFVIFSNNPIGAKSLKRLNNNKDYSLIMTVPERLISDDDKIVGKFKTNEEAETYLINYKE